MQRHNKPRAMIADDTERVAGQRYADDAIEHHEQLAPHRSRRDVSITVNSSSFDHFTKRGEFDSLPEGSLALLIRLVDGRLC